jgi:hypothetical protein
VTTVALTSGASTSGGLAAEMARAGVPLDLEGRTVVDLMLIFRRRERRDPATAVRIDCGREHEGAHGARADVPAAVAVLDAQLDRDGDLGGFGPSVDELHEPQSGPDALDLEGCFRSVGAVVTLAFGKYGGRPVDDVTRHDPGYLRWMHRSSFLPDAKEIAYEALGRDSGREQENARSRGPRVGSRSRQSVAGPLNRGGPGSGHGSSPLAARRLEGSWPPGPRPGTLARGGPRRAPAVQVPRATRTRRAHRPPNAGAGSEVRGRWSLLP